MNQQVIYSGEVTALGARVYRNEALLDPAPCQKLRNHSPDGFAWGYQGSGPAQLALALLYDAVRDATFALDHYQAFKREVVSRWPVDGSWRIKRFEILKWMAGQLADASLN